MRTIQLKDDVILSGIKPMAAVAIFRAGFVFWRYGFDFVITSGQDRPKGADLNKTLHDDGLAFDLRSKHVPRPNLPGLLSDLRHILGEDYDVVLENKGMENEHIHIEHDPK